MYHFKSSFSRFFCVFLSALKQLLTVTTLCLLTYVKSSLYGNKEYCAYQRNKTAVILKCCLGHLLPKWSNDYYFCTPQYENVRQAFAARKQHKNQQTHTKVPTSASVTIVCLSHWPQQQCKTSTNALSPGNFITDIILHLSHWQ